MFRFKLEAEAGIICGLHNVKNAGKIVLDGRKKMKIVSGLIRTLCIIQRKLFIGWLFYHHNLINLTTLCVTHDRKGII